MTVSSPSSSLLLFNFTESLNARLQKNSTFYVTTLIVPKQESTSNSVSWLTPVWITMRMHSIIIEMKPWLFFLDFQCQALHEEEIYALQDELSLFPLGWIHVRTNISPLSSFSLPRSSCCVEIPCLSNIYFFLIVFWSKSPQTHPSQSCFMSSIDLHTQYSYQVRDDDGISASKRLLIVFFIKIR